MHFEYGQVNNRFFLGQIAERIFHAQFKRKMLGLFYFDGIFKLKCVLKIPSGFKITEGIETHTLSGFLERRFS